MRAAAAGTHRAIEAAGARDRLPFRAASALELPATEWALASRRAGRFVEADKDVIKELLDRLSK